MIIKKGKIEPGCNFSQEERGVALLVALFSLSILSLIGLALMMASSTEVLISENYYKSRAAYYAAEAGIEEARYRLGNGAGANGITPPGDTTTAIYIRANTTIDPTTGNATTNKYFDPEYTQITSRDSSGTQTTVASGLTTPLFVSTIQGATNQVPYAWVKITRKTETLAAQRLDSDDTNNSNAVFYGTNTSSSAVSQYVNPAGQSGNFVYLITALAIDPSGARRKIQTEVVLPPPVLAQGAIETKLGVQLNSNLAVSGVKEAGDTCSPGTGVYGVKSEGSVINSPPQDVTGVPTPMCQNCTLNHNIDFLINSLRKSGQFLPIDSPGTNITCSGGSCSGSNVSLGSAPSPIRYYYSSGNLQMTTSGSGYGILIVDGDVTINGPIYYQGIIIARGSFNLSGGGDSTFVNIRGAVIASGGTGNTLGGGRVQYNSCSIANVFNNLPMAVLTFKDRAIY